jgi:carboxyl-terminal processing protease
VVLTNKFSASASEIVAGAIQDYGRGLVIGDNSTHGKGTVQSLIDLGRQLFQRLPNAPSLGAIKITMQQFYRPGGLSTQLEGVKSDVELPSVTTHLPVGEGDLDHVIPFDKVPPANFKPSGRVPEALVSTLRERSGKRVAGSGDFEKVARDIAQYQRRKSEKTISLREDEFARQWNEGKAAEDEEKKLEEQSDPQRPIVKRDYYFQEAMNVTADYLAALAGGIDSLAKIEIPAATPAEAAEPAIQ